MFELLGQIEPWTLAVAMLCSATCAVVGSFLVVRKMSLLGDAISHAILPGLAIGFLLSGSRDPIYMLLGAAGAGLLTAFFSQALTNLGRIPSDTAMGVVFSSFFGLGVILITWVARDIDLDPGCVLYGLIEFVPFDTVSILDHDIPRAFVWSGSIFPIVILLIVLFFKELKLSSFDPDLASALGLNPTFIHYGLMAVVASVAVSSFEIVGSILVVGMLIAPAASIYLFTDDLKKLVIFSGLLGALEAAIGYILAIYWNTSISGVIAGVGFAVFVLSVLFAPRYGFVAKGIKTFLLSLRIAEEDIMGMLYRASERNVTIFERKLLTSLLSPIQSSAPIYRKLAYQKLSFENVLSVSPEGALILSPEGRARGASVIRSHRLWEAYLAKELNLPEDHLHEPSERVEHFITPELQEEIKKEIDTTVDPHGKEIP